MPQTPRLSDKMGILFGSDASTEALINGIPTYKELVIKTPGIEYQVTLAEAYQ
ncbi:MAG: hypothetical protein HC769_23200 [Cyanobacteria bacterium CRU_2_1]|nr:hypothetical protein [Cyanobacteria bacterium CRU_2_1]